jgi:hypothetical protein
VCVRAHAVGGFVTVLVHRFNRNQSDNPFFTCFCVSGMDLVKLEIRSTVNFLKKGGRTSNKIRGLMSESNKNQLTGEQRKLRGGTS